ncbi:MAG: PduL/EutD family phosphate acyltransferase [Christensenellales bacterium]
MVLGELARQGDFRVPVNASSRHIHLCQRDVDALFQPGYQLTRLRDLVQPGQYACQEQIVMQTDAGQLSLRVVGPLRAETQIELLVSEAVKLKIEPLLRLSGDIAGTPGCWLVNRDKRVRLERGVIVAARHMHLSPEESAVYGLRQGDRVSLEVPGPRGTLLNEVIVRSGPGHVLEAHIDREEANACGLSDGQICTILKPASVDAAPGPAAAEGITVASGGLLGETEVRIAIQQGKKSIRYGKGVIVTPLARDAAWENHIELIQAWEP